MAFVSDISATRILGYFGVCGLVIKISRNKLKRSYHAPLAVVLSANVIMLVAIAGNISQRQVLGSNPHVGTNDYADIGLLCRSPMIVALFAITLFCVIFTLLSYPRLTSFYRWFVYLCERSAYLSSKKRFHLWKLGAIQKIKNMKGQGVVVFMKHDTISAMVEALIYVRNNENTSRVAFVHAYDLVDDIPSELVANAKLVDEAFPDITVDLYLVPLHTGFTPSLVEAVSAKLHVPKNLMFIGTISAGHDSPYDLGDYGLRIFRS
ncbi:hypothetical protein QFC19_000737 [Naganishia cerealis]|uniref:Uncharacterized protein n=1 Tax=Naganishia cerealis TaxID=610337 RepID=A0ACC2WLI1_9TREE|nr:hypothetical protein QFC19_000737 [Naganishia cerealis]